MKALLRFHPCFVGIGAWLIVASTLESAEAQIVKPLDKATPLIMRLDTQIVSFDLSGAAALPMGPDETVMDTGVRAVNAQDYNSSRSNNGSIIAPPPNDDPIDLDLLDGVEIELSTSLNLGLDLEFSDLDGLVDFNPVFGGDPVGSFNENALLTPTVSSTSITLDSSKPDLGILEARGWEHRGHVTVLKIAFGGGGGDVDIDTNDIQFNPLAGTSETSIDPMTGVITHAFEAQLSLTGLYNGATFSISNLTGRVVEQGQLSIAIVPEPNCLLLVLGTTLAMLTRRTQG